ncbi:MAG: class I SAM-dependent methyltransferase [Lentisphaerales bacterium]|nr:class I SAM-dependent methyltransferase [Lentisphaerales bacterium]
MLRFNYDKVVDIYDSFELSDRLNEKMTKEVARVLHEKECKNIWDAACGTGAQAIPLAKAGFHMSASDISPHMLRVAKQKSQELRIDYFQSDMTLPLEDLHPDAIITLYNALGHLSKDLFHQALKNFYKILPDGGIFIGDVDNRGFLEKPGKLPADYFMSACDKETGWKRYSKAQATGFGIYHMHDKWLQNEKEKITEEWDLQTWYKEEIDDELYRCGFEVLEWHDREFYDRPEEERDSILFIAQKV